MSATATADPEIEAPGEPSWRDPDIETLRLSRKITSRLRGAKIESVGALVDALDNSETFSLEPREIAAIWHALKSNSDTPHVLIDGPEEEDEPETAEETTAEPPVPEVAKVEMQPAVSETNPPPDETPTAVPAAAEGSEPPKDPPVVVAAAEPGPEPEPQLSAAEVKAAAERAKKDRIDRYNAETVKLISAKKNRVKDKERAWDKAHEEAALAKKDYEREEKELMELIEDREAGQKQPTLLESVKDDAPGEPTPKAPVETSSIPKSSSKLDDLWQQYPIDFERWERWGLTKKDVEKLNSGETKNHGVNPILTMGDVTRFITPNPANPSYARTLKDIKGMGDKGYDRWVDAEEKFWSYWNAGGLAEFAAQKGISDGNEDQPGGTSESAPPVEQAPAADPVADAARAELHDGVGRADANADSETDDSRPLSDAAEPPHPDVAPPAKRNKAKGGKKPRRPAKV